ncbi:MAG: hypothetical protein JXR83_07765 [Deltaproteobacteria bacterium]|nr:hypothetical protein [Deltaproteobacteria bacterium]
MDAGSRQALALAFALAVGLARCQCQPTPSAPDGGSCRSAIDCGAGQICSDAGVCVALPVCQVDADCRPDEQCRAVDHTCRLRPGFGRECTADGECYPGFFCALGRCRDSHQALVCERAVDCPLGMRCDRTHFYCIEEVPCTLASSFPEITCDPDQVCDEETQACRYSGPPECTPENQATTCGPDEVCDAGGRCVQCVNDSQCGPGLRCNARAGRCESEDLCRRDSDCTPPLVCDPAVALCHVPLPPCDSDLQCAVSEYCNRVTETCEPRAGKCIDDRLEENDSPGGATAVTLADGAALLDALQICPDDDDFFAVALAAGDGITATLHGVDAAAHAAIELWAPDAISVLRRSEALPRGNGAVSYTTAAAGIHYLRALSLATPTPYDLEIRVAPRPPCERDALEGATGNDTAWTAAAIGAGFQPGLTLCDGDVDFFRIALEPGAALRARAVGQTLLDPQLRVLDASGTETLALAASGGVSETVFHRSAAGGELLLEVSAARGRPDGYTLTIELAPPFVCAADELDAAARNDRPEQATVAAGDGLLDRALTLCSGDEDWFRVALEDWERLVARATFEAGDVDLDLEAYADGGTRLAAASRAGVGLEALSLPAPGAAIEYWVRVVAADGAAAPYVLTLAREHRLECAPDPDEPNDVSIEAKPAPASGQFTLCGFDEDYYAADLAVGQTLRVSIEFSPAEGDLDLQLLHPDGVTPLLTSDGVVEREQLLYRADIAGIHLVRVYSMTSDPHARYLFMLEVSSGQ